MRPSSLPRVSCLPRLACAALLCGLAGAGAGCDRDTEERQLSQMTNEIDHLRVDQDEANRDFLEPEAAGTHAASVPPRVPAPAQPPAPVVKLGDDTASGAVESPDTEDPTPRPTIRVIGSSRRGDAQSVTDEAPADTGGAARPGALDPAAKRDYEAALSLVTGKQYDAAL